MHPHEYSAPDFVSLSFRALYSQRHKSCTRGQQAGSRNPVSRCGDFSCYRAPHVFPDESWRALRTTAPSTGHCDPIASVCEEIPPAGPMQPGVETVGGWRRGLPELDPPPPTGPELGMVMFVEFVPLPPAGPELGIVTFPPEPPLDAFVALPTPDVFVELPEGPGGGPGATAPIRSSRAHATSTAGRSISCTGSFGARNASEPGIQRHDQVQCV